MAHIPPTRVERARFDRRIVQRPDGCWLYMDTQGTADGYGRFQAGPGKPRVMAHVWAYEARYGPVPPGMQVGHACHDRAVAEGTCSGGKDCPHRRCTNPDHLEAQTPSQNTLAQNHHARNRTTCPRGHLYDEANTMLGKDGKRRCRSCDRARKRAT
jgi:hypothetical protein